MPPQTRKAARLFEKKKKNTFVQLKYVSKVLSRPNLRNLSPKYTRKLP